MKFINAIEDITNNMSETTTIQVKATTRDELLSQKESLF